MQGRKIEQAAIIELLDAARVGRGGFVVLEGEPGSGKTTLCDYASKLAAGVRVVRASAHEAEREVPFSCLEQLIRPLADDVALLPGPQQEAMANALAVDGRPTSPLAVAASFLSLLGVSATRCALLLIVDDEHWIDPASAEVIAFVSRRLSHDAVALLVTHRTGEPRRTAWTDDVQVKLRGLPVDDVRALLVEQTGFAVDQDVAAILTDATRGNPLALVELALLLTENALAGIDELPDPLPLTERLDEMYARRVAATPVATRTALLVVAASGSSSVDVAEAAWTELEVGWADLGVAEASGLIVVNGARIDFVHPLLRSAAYHGADPARRRAAHAALARVARRRGAPDTEARHLAAASTRPDERTATLLEQAADRAWRRGGAAAAMTSMEQAALLSPPGDGRARRLVAAARMLALAGSTERVDLYLEQALQQSNLMTVRAEAARLRCMVMAYSGDSRGAVDLARAEARAIAHQDREIAAMVLCEVALPSAWDARASEPVELAREAYDYSLGTGGVAELMSTCYLASMLLFVGETEEGERLLEVTYAAWRDRPVEQTLMFPGPTLAFFMVEDYRRVDEIFADATGAARRYGALAALPFYLASKAEVDFSTGDWANAYVEAMQCVELAEATNQGPVVAYGLATLARVEAGQGLDDAARVHASQAIELGQMVGGRYAFVYAQSALGLLALTRGDPFEARDHLRPVFEWLVENEWIGMLTKERGLRDLIEATHLTGDVSEAERLLSTFEAASRGQRRWVDATVLFCRALTMPDDLAIPTLIRSVELYSRTRAAFDEARTRLALGARLMGVGRESEATMHLAVARQTFRRLGATPWIERTDGLRTTASRREPAPSWADLLTPHERQVAVLVANGASNKEAAQQLFVTQKTIEFHLGNIYRKLDLRSRSQLTQRFWSTS